MNGQIVIKNYISLIIKHMIRIHRNKSGYFMPKASVWLGIFFLLNPLISSGQAFRAFAVSEMVRVFEDGFNLKIKSDTLSMFGIKGETISGQIVVNSLKDLEKVSVETGTLTDSPGGNVFPENACEWNFVGSVFLPENASNQPENAVIRKAPARFPDYLMTEKQLDISAGKFQAVWLTIKIPKTVLPGNYMGSLTVRCRQGEQKLPMQLTVYPLIMPDTRHLKVTEWYTTAQFEKFHGITAKYSQEWFGMLRRYADNMAEHRQNVFEVPMNSIEVSKTTGGELEFDFSRFDQIAQVFWDTRKMDYLETGELARFKEGGFASNEIVLKDFSVTKQGTGEVITMPGNEVIPSLLPAFESHLRQKGWLDKTLFHIKDEPSHHNALSWINVSSYIHKYAPDLKRIDAVCTSFLSGNIEIAVPKLDHLDAGYDIYRKEQQKGNELWFYTVGIYQASLYPNKTVDMPLIDSRLLHWINYRYDLGGYLHWGWNQWNEDPFRNVGEHAGDAWHVYPSKDGVLNSLRWEEMRNGIQDYEYFKLLENKVADLRDSLGTRFSWIDPTQRGKEIISQVIMGFKEHSDDPSVLIRARKEVIDEIITFDKSPRVYIQTNPIEHGKIINRSVVELLGWTDPGSEIVVNGSRLPVNADGLFMERYIIYKGGKLTIKAKNGTNEKVMIRNFNVTY
jgi:hypothetical protein